MRFRTIPAVLCVLMLLTLASAQTKISGTAQCGKPDTQQKVNVPDHTDHSLSISQAKCTWTKPMEVAGVQDKDGVTTAMDDNHGATSKGHGYYVDNIIWRTATKPTSALKQPGRPRRALRKESGTIPVAQTSSKASREEAHTRAKLLPMAAQRMTSRANIRFPSSLSGQSILFTWSRRDSTGSPRFAR